MKHIALLVFMATSAVGYGQFTKGPVEVKSKGGDSFTLEDSVAVYTYPPRNSSFAIGVNVLVSEDDFNPKDSSLSADVVFYNEDLKSLGHSNSALEISQYKKPEPYRLRKYYWIHLDGSVPVTHIRRKTIPDEEFYEEMNTSKRGVRGPALETYLERFDFIKDESTDLPTYVILQNHKSLDEEPGFRMILVLRGSSPLCVITNGVDFPIKTFKAQENDLGYTFTYFSKPNVKIREQLLDIAYTYTPL